MTEPRMIRADQVGGLISELVSRCEEQGVRVDAYLVGGAALTLQLERPRMTPDLDVLLLNPDPRIVSIAEAMADELSLDPAWLNSRAFAFLAGMDDEQDTEAALLDFPGHRIRVASPRYLLAMKIAAMRAKDVDDAAACVRYLGYRDADAIVTQAIATLGRDSMAWDAPHDADLHAWLLPEAVRVLRRAWSGDALWDDAPARRPTQ
ncbi:MAG: hypothetical protein CMF56_00135 [Leifsonia sp.]|nr:hypothetical protein [Leifsonia sp.]|tara:strand:- start:3897 stop:4514 length:618 start_codon:yes stop_codon:yes gene_type:complete